MSSTRSVEIKNVYGEKIRAVCLVLYNKPSEKKRKEKTHSSKVLMINDHRKLGFPGGVVESFDRNPWDTALREFKEEVLFKDFKGGYDKTKLLLNERMPQCIEEAMHEGRAQPLIFKEWGVSVSVLYYLVEVSLEIMEEMCCLGMIPFQIEDGDSPKSQVKNLRRRDRKAIPHIKRMICNTFLDS